MTLKLENYRRGGCINNACSYFCEYLGGHSPGSLRSLGEPDRIRTDDLLRDRETC